MWFYFSMVCFSTVCFLYDVLLHGMVFYDVLLHSTAFLDVLLHSVVFHDVLLHKMVFYDVLLLVWLSLMCFCRI